MINSQRNLSTLSKRRKSGTSREIAAAAVGIGILAVLLIVFNIGIFVLAIAGIAWGIYDITQVGANFWAILYIIVGGLIVLGSIFRSK